MSVQLKEYSSPLIFEARVTVYPNPSTSLSGGCLLPPKAMGPKLTRQLPHGSTMITLTNP